MKVGAAGAFGRVRLFVRVLDAVTWVVTRMVSRRGLGLAFLAAMAGLAVSGWVRPPIGTDIRSVRIPLFASAGVSSAATDFVYGPRRFVPLSAGTLMLATVGVGAVLVIVRTAWLRVSLGLVLCALLVGLAAVVLNHPDWVEELNRQNQDRRALAAVLAATAEPPIPITSYPRISGTPLTGPTGELLGMLIYLPPQLPLAALAAFVAVASAYSGPLRRRAAAVAMWFGIGVVAAVSVSGARLLAEGQWFAAVRDEQAGRLEESQRRVQAAVTRFPALARLKRTWSLTSSIDYRLGRRTPAARLFLADQWARNGDAPRALADLEDLNRLGQPTPEVGRWLADALFQRGVSLFDERRLDAAEGHWERAVKADPSQVYRRLFAAALRAPLECDDANRVAQVVDPLLGGMADRALRAALEAMLGDCYFQCRQFADARVRYETSMQDYSLPKQINYRALRGLLGM